MCCICGIFNYANSSFDIKEELLTSMCRQISHRGPDDEGVYIDSKRRVGLGHRRLSIIDLSTAGHQPMANEDRSIWITYNGEIYNHQEIREELEKKGH